STIKTDYILSDLKAIVTEPTTVGTPHQSEQTLMPVFSLTSQVEVLMESSERKSMATQAQLFLPIGPPFPIP
ncbi:MAG: hypothetical protein AAF223_04540, partial [Bacteroidota bacterium]